MTATDPRPEAERDRIRAAHLKPAAERPRSTARGLHHTALISGDVEQTVRFYQDVLGFPLTELIENRDYPGSSHFFFDIGNGNGAQRGLGLLPRPRRIPHRADRRPARRDVRPPRALTS